MNGMTPSSKPGLRTQWRALLLACVLALSACGAVELAYSMAPRLAVEFADEYFYLNTRQESEALALFKARKAEHEVRELPLYYAFAERVEQRFLAGLTPESLDASIDEGEQLLRQGVRDTMPAIAEIMAGLDEDQRAYFVGKLEEKEQEYRERIAEERSDKEREENEFEDMEEWIGELNEEQKRLIRSHVARMHDNRPLWLAWRVARNDGLGQLLLDNAGQQEIESFLKRSWVDRVDLPAELAERSTHNRQQSIEMILALQETLTDKQRDKVLKRIREARELVLALMPAEVERELLAVAVRKGDSQ
ncbi:MAG: DUF6279 family lipoprotein [Gammaproteobacteria bacterium]|nr:DUF6279 family lipoprotein [Gammaproteobacteria bacterium]